ncbi:hypothetical protein CQJ94_05060 [Glycomyces fuscus]|nr:hypothetical protein CQJ94_05060 [Glycomyces fuscus]
MHIPRHPFAPSVPVLLSGVLLLSSAGCADDAPDAAAPAASTAPVAEPDGSPSAAGGTGAGEAPSGFAPPEEPYAAVDAELSERLHLPVYDYRLDEYEAYVVARAADTLTVECLVDLGYEASVNAELEMGTLTMRAFGPHHEYRRYGNMRLDVAEEYGYGLPDEVAPDPYRLGGGEDLRAEARGAVTAGGEDFASPSGEPVPEGGCLGWARRQIDPDSALPYEVGEDGGALDVPESHVLVEELLGESYSAAMGDPAVVGAAAAWDTCMSGVVEGFHGTPGSGEGADADTALPALECRDSSGYTDAFVAAERALLEDLITEHEEALTARRDRLRENLETALDVLGW